MKKLQADPLNGSILKNMIKFALPVMGISLLYVLYSSLDTMIVGKFGHENAVSAIGATQSVLWTIIAVVESLAAGVSMVFSKLYGEDKKEEINKLLNALPLSIAFISVILAAVAIIAAPLVLEAVQCPTEIYADALTYFRVYFLCVPFMCTFSFLTCAVQSKGDSFTPFIFQVTSQCLNLCLNLLFVIVFDLNIFGVAIATVISESFSLCLMIIHLSRQKNELHLSFRKLKFFTGTGEIWKKGVPSSLEGFALNITAVVLSAFINTFSADVIAGNTISGSIEGLMMVGFSGFESGSVVFIAQNLGAKNYKRVKKVFWITLVFVFGLCESIGGVALLFAKPLTGLFTDNAKIQAIAIHRMQFLCLTYGFCGLMNSLAGCIRGLQDAKTPLVISIISSVFFRLGWLLTVSRTVGTLESIYIAYPLTWALATVLSLIAFLVIYKKKCKEVNPCTKETIQE